MNTGFGHTKSNTTLWIICPVVTRNFIARFEQQASEKKRFPSRRLRIIPIHSFPKMPIFRDALLANRLLRLPALNPSPLRDRWCRRQHRFCKQEQQTE
ncbi:MAG: hypothetical protein CMM01_17645 [Rhodopirellula sp.]|nr:hypothetical protein [Rhodopirellula sp.]